MTAESDNFSPISGVELIALERRRQIEVEGWTPEHDADHDSGEMIDAARTYALAAKAQGLGTGRLPDIPFGWPWGPTWWKPSTDPVRNLVKAGALLAAEIDRLQSGENLDEGT